MLELSKLIPNPEKSFLVTEKVKPKTPAMNFNPATALVGKRLNRTFNYVVIPVLGIAIPNIAGIISNELYSNWELLFSYAFFVGIALLIWKGNVRLLYYIRKYNVELYDDYFRIVLTYLTANIFYSFVVSTIALYGWRWMSREPSLSHSSIFVASLFVVISVIFINNIFEIILLRKEMEYNRMRAQKMEVAKVEAELEALKSQIDPHFIFNSLNTLSYLITREPQSAKLYNDTLAKVYRYILSNKEKDLVLLKEELEFISNYFYLLKIRFSEAVNMVIEIIDLNSEDYLIPPISLQTLVENAIKHNEFSEMHPLDIKIAISTNFVVIRNPVRPKEPSTPSNKIGLNNLDNRYKLITRRNIVVENNFKYFTVRLPILKF